MASQRAGLNDKLKTREESRPLNALIRPREEIEAEQAAEKELTKREKEELARKQRKLKEDQEKAAREKYMQYKKVENKKTGRMEAPRKTFVVDPISMEALRRFAFYNDKDHSEVLTDMFLKYIPREIWVEARNTVINIEETPKDYLDNLKKLDIDSIYYHPYKPNEE